MKRLIGGTEGRNNIAPVEYPWAIQAYDDMQNNAWVPGEINMGTDRKQYHHDLPLNLKHTYKTVFSTLTTSDVLILRNTVTVIAALITAPEVENLLAIHGFQEANHNRTYQLMIENLGLDENEVYTLYETVPAIRQKFELAAYYTGLLGSDKMVDVLKGLVFYYLGFEGVFFYNGFSPIFAMPRSHGFMLASTDQLAYIARDEAFHANYGIDLIAGIMQETGVRLAQPTVAAVMKDVAEAERVYANYAIQQWSGYNAGTHVGHAEYMADLWLKKLGYAPVFGTPSQLPWLSEIIELKKETAFFERRVTEYRVGAVMDFDDTVKGIDVDALWR